jgi:hypothetical protein
MQGPDTDAQDQPPPFINKFGLQRTAGPYSWVKCRPRRTRARGPLCSYQLTSQERRGRLFKCVNFLLEFVRQIVEILSRHALGELAEQYTASDELFL